MTTVTSTLNKPLPTGILLVLTWALTLVDTLQLADTRDAATVLVWSFIAIEFTRMTRKQRTPVTALMAAGAGFGIWAWWETGQLNLMSLLDEHIKLAMLLTAVSFIRLATKVHAGGKNTGFKSFAATFGGMHLFSSVANFSSLFLFGDQVRKTQSNGAQLNPLSYRLLTRGFSLAIFWSPFLSMIPLILELVPGVEMGKVYPWALTIVAFGFLLTLAEARWRNDDELTTYQGYPITLSSLALPVLLIATLLLVHQLLPDLPMLVVISTVAVAIPLIWLLVLKGAGETTQKVQTHIREQLPNTRPEISLFLAAGFLAAGVKACIAAGLIHSPFGDTNALVAASVMLLIFVISSLGIHQFALVAIFAGLMAHNTVTPHLMAIAYMMGVSLAMSGSLFSGVNIIIHNQFKVPNRAMLRDNMPYSIIMLLFATGILFIMEANGVR